MVVEQGLRVFLLEHMARRVRGAIVPRAESPFAWHRYAVLGCLVLGIASVLVGSSTATPGA